MTPLSPFLMPLYALKVLNYGARPTKQSVNKIGLKSIKKNFGLITFLQ